MKDEHQDPKTWIKRSTSNTLILALLAAILVLMLATFTAQNYRSPAQQQPEQRTEQQPERQTEQTPEKTEEDAAETREPVLLTAEDAARILLPGETITPMEALCRVQSRSEVTAEWAAQPDFTCPGMQKCSVLLTDEDGNETMVEVSIFIASIAECLDCEIGGERPQAKDFFVGWDGPADFATDLNAIDWSSPGIVELELSAGGRSYRSCIRLLDRNAPVLRLLPFAVMQGGAVTAEDFVLSCEDVSPVSFRFEEEPDTSSLGEVPVTILAEDAGGNVSREDSVLYICDQVFFLEASTIAMTESQIRQKLPPEYASYYRAERQSFTPKDVGVTVFRVYNYADAFKTIGFVIRDTVPPEAHARQADCFLSYPIPAEQLLSEIQDPSPVTVTYEKAPDWDQPGIQLVSLVLTDSSGNSSSMTVVLRLVPDDSAPEIRGVADRIYYVGDAVSYFSSVLVVDNADPECELSVDKSQVNPRKVGTYPVTYTAADHAGNSTSVTVQYTFIEQCVSDEELDELAQQILSEILTEDMSTAEQAKAIFDYLYYNIHYIRASDKDDWKSEAYRGLTKFQGDCFTFYASSYLLLSKIDCEVMCVERTEGLTRHYWCLVNLGTGWYHFDPCNTNPYGVHAFMMTDAQLEYYENGYYWHYDKSLYPEVETEPFEMF